MVTRNEPDVILQIVSNGQRGHHGAIAMLKENVNVDLKVPIK